MSRRAGSFRREGNKPASFTVWLSADSADLWIVDCQAPLTREFSRQEYWSGLPFPTPGDLQNPRIKPKSLLSPTLVGGFLTTSATTAISLMPGKVPPHSKRSSDSFGWACGDFIPAPPHYYFYTYLYLKGPWATYKREELVILLVFKSYK